MISECLGRRSKGLYWTSNSPAFRACVQLQNYIPGLFVQVAAVRFEEGFCVLQRNIDRAGNRVCAPGVRVVFSAAPWNGSSVPQYR